MCVVYIRQAFFHTVRMFAPGVADSFFNSISKKLVKQKQFNHFFPERATPTNYYQQN
jgi:hypothetical protein